MEILSRLLPVIMGKDCRCCRTDPLWPPFPQHPPSIYRDPLPTSSIPAISSPSKPLSPPSSRSKHLTSTPPNWRSNKKSSVLSPNTTPQRQLAFSTIAATSTTSSSAGGGVSGVAVVGTASSDPRGLAQSYTLTMNHNLSTSSPTSPDISFGSSTGSLPPSPSPAQVVSPIAAYRGRRPLTGRALDGSLLARLSQGDSDSDVDE
ncbi:hypothetical protein BGW80DRAFT_521833 [Lactifluus volemus]|nr:hypothetical protein BGW80DRAFT_521833 [Lactifluus volemus]